ncbi:hypothetical protein N602_24265 [Mycobacterium avium subsp. hominissuis 10-5606]|nr:hypothetical protein N602_24265 [Mycobacterium avium subsp. hominissuis 10-5606]
MATTYLPDGFGGSKLYTGHPSNSLRCTFNPSVA